MVRAGKGGAQVVLGLRANWRQFALLVAVNAFVGGMVGLERTVLPILGEAEFGIASKTAVLSFIATFGLTKALTNLLAGGITRRFTRRAVLIAGWAFGLPVPFLIIWAPSWGWVLFANVLLGINQGLAWSMTVNMKVDLVGPRRRGLALGFNEAAGYMAVAGAAYASGMLARRFGLRPEPFYLGVGFAAAGTAISVLLVRDTSAFVAMEAAGQRVEERRPSLWRSFAETSWRRPYLFGVSQAGFVNNLNDALAWGMFPLLFACRGLELGRIAALAGAYPLVWGSLQLLTGWASDRAGAKRLIVGGMVLQGAAIALAGVGDTFGVWMAAVVLLGVGTALVYPTLLAAIGNAVHPAERATCLGVYRFWRDGGFVVGALGAGALADLFGLAVAVQAVAGLTVASGVVAAVTMGRERLHTAAATTGRTRDQG